VSRFNIRRRFKRFVSAITGRFVTRRYAEQNPAETYERTFEVDGVEEND
jgi:hypothetical protein